MLLNDFLSIFLQQKNGADPTEAAPDQTTHSAGLVKIRASRSRDSASGNGSESWRLAIRPSLQRRAQDWAAVRVSHHLVLPRYPAFFSSSCLFPGGTPPIVHSPNVDASVPAPGFLFTDLLSSNPVPEGVPRTGVRDRRGSTGRSSYQYLSKHAKSVVI